MLYVCIYICMILVGVSRKKIFPSAYTHPSRNAPLPQRPNQAPIHSGSSPQPPLLERAYSISITAIFKLNFWIFGKRNKSLVMRTKRLQIADSESRRNRTQEGLSWQSFLKMTSSISKNTKNLPEGTPIPDRSMQHLKGGNRKEKSSPCTNGPIPSLADALTM